METHSQGTWVSLYDAQTAAHRDLERENGLLRYAVRDIRLERFYVQLNSTADRACVTVE